jgi:predicted Zn finger-like uncharacterized protein
MFTTCPNCRLNLAVTAMDLRVGQGYVRCGRCERVFNALLSLSEDLDQAQQSGHVATGTTSMPALEDSALVPTPADTSNPETPSASAASLTHDLSAEDDDASWAKITPLRQPVVPTEMNVVETQATGTFETIVLEGDGFLQTEEHVEESEFDAQLQKLARQMNAADDLEANVHPDEEIVMETADEAADEFDADLAVGNAPRQHWGWAVAAGLLVLTLLVQIVHYNRQSLVAHPWFERPLQAVYAAFGVTLEPKWDLRAYDLRQLGGEAAGTSSNIVLRATVHNRAASSQPPPMIRAVLQDRFGNALSTTAISPQEYLHGDAPSRMAPDQRLDAELSLRDPNRQAVGFELDACLPGADGKLHCSTDP